MEPMRIEATKFTCLRTGEESLGFLITAGDHACFVDEFVDYDTSDEECEESQLPTEWKGILSMVYMIGSHFVIDIRDMLEDIAAVDGVYINNEFIDADKVAVIVRKTRREG